MLLDLQPGDALGPFQLGEFHPSGHNALLSDSGVPGATLFNLLNLLQNYRQAYPAVKVAWDEDVRCSLGRPRAR